MLQQLIMDQIILVNFSLIISKYGTMMETNIVLQFYQTCHPFLLKFARVRRVCHKLLPNIIKFLIF